MVLNQQFKPAATHPNTKPLLYLPTFQTQLPMWTECKADNLITDHPHNNRIKINLDIP
jgi:hypothetical protein